MASWYPDPSAADLTEEQIARINSDPFLRPGEDPTPTTKMVGFGKYRRVAGTSNEFQIATFGEELRRLGTRAIDAMEGLPIAQFNDGVMAHIRHLSVISSSSSGSSLGLRESSEESIGSTLICRGFGIGKPLLPPQGDSQHKDQASNHAPDRPSPEQPRATAGTRPLQRKSVFSGITRAPTPLNLVQDMYEPKPTKKVVPCVFDAEGASGAICDDDDDSDFESCLTSAVSSKVDGTNMLKPSEIAGLLENRARKPQTTLPPKTHMTHANRTTENKPEKPKLPSRRFSRQVAKRVISRGRKTTTIRHSVKESVPLAGKPPQSVAIQPSYSSSGSIPPPQIFSPDHLQVSSSESADVQPDPALYVEEPRGRKRTESIAIPSPRSMSARDRGW